MHRANLPLATLGSMGGAATLVAMQWQAVAAQSLLGWLGLLGAVLAVRVYWGRALALRADMSADLSAAPVPGQVPDRAGLRRLRQAFVLHGLAWGLAGWLPLQDGDWLHLTSLVLVLGGVTGASFMLTAFDLGSALCFGVPVLSLLSLRLLSQADATHWTLGVAVLATLAFLSLAARRAHFVVRRYVTLRVTEAAQSLALRRSEDLLACAGAMAKVGGWEIDTTTLELRLTPQVFRIHDLDAATPLDIESFLALYGASEQSAIRAALAAALAYGTAFDIEVPLVTALGRARHVRLISKPLVVNGQVQRLNGVVQDITLARSTALALAEQLHLMNLLVRTTREGFWFVDVHHVTTEVNPAMCEILGRPREDIVGRSVFDFVDADNAKIVSTQVNLRAAHLPSSYEFALLRPDGSLVDCFSNATTTFDTAGRHTGSIGMISDISARKRSERQLRRTSDELSRKTQALQVTLDAITHGLVSTDANGHFTVYNRRALEMLDLPQWLFGPEKTIHDVLEFQTARGDLGDDFSFIEAELRPRFACKNADNTNLSYVRRTRTGGHIEVLTRRLPGGGLVRTFSDVSKYFEAQQAARDSEADLRALLDAFPGCIAVKDARFNYTYVNNRFAALVGKSREDMIGQSVSTIMGPQRQALLQEESERARLGLPVTVEREFAVAGQSDPVWLQITHAVGSEHSAERSMIYSFGIDVSARKLAEQSLIEAREEAERANRAKSKFLSSMSHELRTPMNAILGFGQLLLADAVDPLAARQRVRVDEVLRGANHLLSLINEMLDMAQIESGRMQVALAPVAVEALIHESLGMLEPLASSQGIEMRAAALTGGPDLVLADRTRLKQVLINLLSNAIKYNRPNGHVHIECSATPQALRIEISDSGPGLSRDQCARLFQAFERLDAGQTRVEGAGLGLALSKHLMLAMHGDIGVDSEPGIGSTFWISLPRAQALAWVEESVTVIEPPLEPGAEGEGADGAECTAVAAGAVGATVNALTSAARRRTVLYIEDNPINVLVMQAMLARLPNLRLSIATLPMTGLEIALSDRPDLILLDIQLPGIDGFEVLRRLRGDPASRAIPVIAVSANAMASDIEQGLAAGFVEYLTKPLQMTRLLAAVEAALAGRRL